METYADRLQWGMARLDISQSELARRLEKGGTGLTQQSINHLLKSSSQGSKHTSAIARELKLNPDWLADGTGQRLAEDARPPVAITLKTLRKRASLTPEEVAKAIGIPVYQYRAYEVQGKSVRLPKRIADALNKLFSDRGIESHHSVLRVGIEQESGQAEGARAARSRSTDLAETVMIPHLDVLAAAGAGGEDPREVDADPTIIAQWQIPADVLRQFTPGPADGLYWLTTRGNSMEPAIPANAPVLVNTRDKTPSPPGIFVVWDGIALVVKNVQAIPFSDPVRVKISSENPSFDPYERVEDEAYIQGRVIANVRAT